VLLLVDFGQQTAVSAFVPKTPIWTCCFEFTLSWWILASCFFIYRRDNGCALLRIRRWLASHCEVWTTCANSHIQLLLNLSDVLRPVQRSCLLYQWRILVILLHTCQLIWQTSMTDCFLGLFRLGLATCQVCIKQPEQQLYKSPCDFHCIRHRSTWLPLSLCNSYQLFWKCLPPNVSPRLQGTYMLVVVTRADR
jgi:hypothetical protein